MVSSHIRHELDILATQDLTELHVHDLCARLARTEGISWEREVSSRLTRRRDGCVGWFWSEAVPEQTLLLPWYEHFPETEAMLGVHTLHDAHPRHLVELRWWPGIAMVVGHVPLDTLWTRQVTQCWHTTARALPRRTQRWDSLIEAVSLHQRGHRPRPTALLHAYMEACQPHPLPSWDPFETPWSTLDLSPETRHKAAQHQLINAAHLLLSQGTYTDLRAFFQHITVAHTLCWTLERERLNAADMMRYMERVFADHERFLAATLRSS